METGSNSLAKYPNLSIFEAMMVEVSIMKVILPKIMFFMKSKAQELICSN